MKFILDSKKIPIVKSWLWDYDFLEVYSYSFDFFFSQFCPFASNSNFSSHNFDFFHTMLSFFSLFLDNFDVF